MAGPPPRTAFLSGTPRRGTRHPSLSGPGHTPPKDNVSYVQSVIVVRFSETISDNRVGDVGDLGFGPKVVSGPFLTISTR